MAEIVAEANQKLKDSDKKTELVLTNEQGTFNSGVILKRGRSRTVQSVDAIITDLRDRYEADVKRVLSGEDLA